VKQSDRSRDVDVAQSGEPTGPAVRQGLGIAPHCFDEQQLG
jgi:hypothetical protein